MALDITKRHLKGIQEAINQAELSPCLQKHGAVISGNGKICGKGFNNYRTQFNDNRLNDCTSCHAEIAAIRNALKFNNNNMHQLKVAEEYNICG